MGKIVAGQGRTSRCRTCLAAHALLLSSAALIVIADPLAGHAQQASLPAGGSVVSGAAAISSPSATSVLVTQSSRNAIVNWSSFSVGAGSSARFENGSGATLNRVTGLSSSLLDGSLSASGSLYLVNPNGITVGPTGTVTTGGTFVASTHDVSDAEFNAGGAMTFKGASTASVINYGSIGALGGDVALIARKVENAGTITAPNGTVGLAAGYEVLVRDAALSDGKFVVKVGGGDTEAKTTGVIKAAEAELKANGGNVYALAGNTESITKATGVSSKGGRIFLTAGDGGSVQVTQKVSARAAATNGKAKGGEIQVSGGTVKVSGTLDTKGEGDAGGSVTITGTDLTLAGTAVVDVSGATGGGSVRIGGDVKGGGTLAHARTVTVEAGSVINANATATGNGGSVVLWSDGVTNFAGTISANGGALGGDGGFVETSGHELGFGAGLQVTTTAANGATGTWLLDPYDVTISNAADSFISVDTASSPNTATPSGSGTNLNVTTLQIALGSNNMVVQTSGAGSDAGNITVLQSVIWAADTTLTLNADTSTGGILLDGTVTGTGSGSRLVLNAGAGGINQAASYITVNTLNATTTNGGSIALTSSVNAITTLGTSSASGSFALTNGQDLNVSGPITSNGTLSLVTTIGDLNINVALSDSQAGASYTLSAADALNISKDLTLSGAGAQLSLSAGSSYSLLSGARVSLPDSGASLSIDGQAYTLIHDAAGLQSVSGASFYALGNDIDASATSGWNSGAGFQAIDNFYGTLAGLGHFVDRLTINRPGQSTQGLFGLMSGTARDLTLSNVSINGNSIVGGVAGRLSNGTLSNVHVTGTVTGQGALVGGLVGWSDIAVIDLSSSAASVSGTDEVGGLVGRNRVGSITTSYATGAVTGTGSGVGGLVGTSVQGSTLTDVYASGLVTGASGTGGVVGSWDATPITTNNVYWDMDSTGQSTSVVGTGFSSGSARTQSTYAGFDFSNVWVMIAGETRPMLRNEYSTVIAMPAALQLMSQDLTASYRLGANIDLTTAFTADGNGNYAGLWGASGFVPIGNSGTPFSGSFDGQGHTITGLTINRSGTNYVGLFGYTNGATISNVTLSGGSITGNDDVSPLIGYMLGGSVSSASASATVTGASTSETNVGGLVGANDGGAISRASASGNVTGAGYQIGGLVGYLVNGGSITQSYATGSVTGTNTGAGMGYIGGLVGASGFTGNDGGTISQSYATGTVTGSSGPIGGFIGHNAGTITDAYATGRVIGLGSASNVGGFVGVNHTDGVITAAYSTGYVSGGAQVGGFAGYNNASASAITSAYWDTQTSGQASGIAGGSGGITARTTAQLQGTLPAGFSPSIWGTGTNLYPYFTWRYATTPVAVSGIAYSDAGTTALAGSTVTAVSGGSGIGSAVTGNNGYYYILAPASALASSGVLTYLDNGTTKGAAFSDVVGANGIQNVAIHGTAAHIITGESTLAATQTNYLAARGSYADTDLSFLSATSVAPLTTTAGYGVYLNTTGNYTLNADLGSAGLLTIDSGGTFGVSGAITLAAAGALTIADAVSWSDASSLTLSTTSGGNISLAGAVTGAAGTLIVSASGTATTSSAVNVGTFRLDGGTWHQVAATLPSFAATNFVLGSGTTFLRATGGDGSAATPYQVGDVYGLQGVGSTSLLSQSFVLAADIDASGTSNWNSGAGFNPIGSDLGNFLGSFDGGGHTISGLVVNNSVRAGLFGVIGDGATVSNLTVGGTVNGVVAGVLAAYNLGTVSNVKTSGSVLNAGNPNAGFAYLGGLVGIDQGNGSILNSSSSATVTNSQANTNAGGLAGASQNASISNSFATGAVTSTTATNTTTAGLVAANFGAITGSYATGSVSGGLYSGGLVAVNSGSISNAFATGSVSGATYAGGLAAVNAGTITGSYATGDVSGAVYSGGLVAVNSWSISNAFATGAVSGTTYAGGLVGRSYGTISNSYATGNVTADTYAGGFIGYDDGAISNSYSTGSVSGATYRGGFIGYLNSGAVTASFWNTTTSGTALGIGAGSSTGVTGLTTAQLSSLSTFTGAGWDIDDAGGTGAVWRIYDGYTMPLLRSFMTALTVTGGSGSKTYDGSATSASVGTLTYNPSGYTAVLVLGGALYTASSADAGSYSGAGLTLGGLYSSQLGYDITFVSGSLAVGQAALTATVSDASKTYDGLAYSGGAGVTYSGLVNGETSAVLGGTLAYGGTAQGAVNAGGYGITASGLTSTNYAITYVPGTLTVNTAALTFTAINDSKTYDGLAYSGGTGVSYSGFVAGETSAVLGGTLVYSGTAQGAVNVGSYSLTASGLTSGNYTISYVPGTLTVSPAALTVTANAATKTYDGAAYAGGNGVSYSGFAGSDSAASLGGTLAYGGTSQGAVNAGSYSITASGLTSGNYAISYVPGTLTIGQAALTVTANNAGKTYDGLAYSGGAGVTYSGFVAGETSAVLGGTLAYGGTAQGAVNAGSYGITASGPTSGNYAITYAAGTLTVGTAALTVTANNDGKTYDGLAYSGGAGVTYSGFVAGETSAVLGGTLAYGGTAQGAVNAGSYGITASGLTSGNYAISYVPGTLSVSQAALAVAANAQTMRYGDATPALTYAITGGSLFGSDTLTGALATSATSASGVGSYAITQGSLAASSNYALTYAGGSVLVTPRPLIVTADDQSWAVGPGNPALTYRIGGRGLVNGDQLAGALSTTADAASPAGRYPILQGTLAASANYALTYEAGLLTVIGTSQPVQTEVNFVETSVPDQFVLTLETEGLIAVLREPVAQAQPAPTQCGGTSSGGQCAFLPVANNLPVGQRLSFRSQ